MALVFYNGRKKVEKSKRNAFDKTLANNAKRLAVMEGLLGKIQACFKTYGS